jgi:hypothetical protein
MSVYQKTKKKDEISAVVAVETPPWCEAMLRGREWVGIWVDGCNVARNWERVRERTSQGRTTRDIKMYTWEREREREKTW